MRLQWYNANGRHVPLTTSKPVRKWQNCTTGLSISPSSSKSPKKLESYEEVAHLAIEFGKGAIRNMTTTKIGSQLLNRAQLKTILRNPTAIKTLRNISFIKELFRVIFPLSICTRKLVGLFDLTLEKI